MYHKGSCMSTHQLKTTGILPFWNLKASFNPNQTKYICKAIFTINVPKGLTRAHRSALITNLNPQGWQEILPQKPQKGKNWKKSREEPFNEGSSGSLLHPSPHTVQRPLFQCTQCTIKTKLHTVPTCIHTGEECSLFGGTDIDPTLPSSAHFLQTVEQCCC